MPGFLLPLALATIGAGIGGAATKSPKGALLGAGLGAGAGLAAPGMLGATGAAETAGAGTAAGTIGATEATAAGVPAAATTSPMMKGLGGIALGGQVGGTLGDVFKKQPVEQPQMNRTAPGGYNPTAYNFMNFRNALRR